MCLAIPAQIIEIAGTDDLAMVEVSGVRRKVNVGLLDRADLVVGDWVLVHVGFAMSKISQEQAREQMRILALLGEGQTAIEEIQGYDFGDTTNKFRL